METKFTIQYSPNVDDLCSSLEEQEIESPAGVAMADVYTQLLALYLLQNDLPNAKYLWKRIPQPVKFSTPELQQIWLVAQKQWQRHFPEMYKAMDKDWSERIKPLMAQLLEITRQRAILLVAQAYSSISFEDLSAFLGLSEVEAVNLVSRLGWRNDNQARMIIPKAPEKKVAETIPSEDQIARLTSFVSFLET